MPYIENETKAKLREVRNSAEPVFIGGVKEKIVHYELSKDHFYWLLEQAETLAKIRKEAQELNDEEIDLTDFGERVSNII